MAVPARRTSKTKKRMRRTHLKKELPGVITCPKCGAPIKAHRACPEWVNYKGKEVIETKSEN